MGRVQPGVEQPRLDRGPPADVIVCEGRASPLEEVLQETGGDVPIGQIGAVLAVAVAAGLLASVLPARRAARLSPVAGLAAD